MTYDEIVGVFESRAPVRNGATRCPAHDDRQASLMVRRGDDGRTVVKCHAGCEPAVVLDAVGLSMTDLFEKPLEAKGPVFDDSYKYVDEEGRHLYTVIRYRDPKGFRQRAASGAWTLDGVRRVPYRLPELRRAIEGGRPVLLCEGEKDVHSAERVGAVATSIPGGANNQWTKNSAYWLPFFAGATVHVVADDDGPGLAYARSAVAALRGGVAAGVRAFRPAVGNDLSDHLAAGRSLADLIPLEDEPEAQAEQATMLPDWWSQHGDPRTLIPRPEGMPEPMRQEAFHGPIGEAALRAWETSEAAPEAILGSLLCGIGAQLPDFRVAMGDGRYGCNLFVLLVGPSALGRKGASWNTARRILEHVDHDFMVHRLVTGAGSGEVLIDEVNKTNDTRVLYQEEEFGRLLVVANREGSTMSAVLRQAWDGGVLRAITRGTTTPDKIALRSHLAVLGHLTPSDLAVMRGSDVRNGFANRFIFLATYRTRALPLSPGMDPGKARALARTIRDAMVQARMLIEEGWTGEEVVTIGQDVQAQYVHDERAWVPPQGDFEEVYSRYWPNLMKVAGLYAVLDGVTEIQTPHYLAARAVMDYSQASIGYSFGQDEGAEDPKKETERRQQQRLLDALKTAGRAGLSGRERTAAVGRKYKAVHINAIAEGLVRAGLAVWGSGSAPKLFISERGHDATED